MRAMSMLQRGETTLGPLAFDGRTITLVARTTALHIDGRLLCEAAESEGEADECADVFHGVRAETL